MTGEAYRYTVEVDDNFHYMDEESRNTHGEFASYQEAVNACKAIIDAFLKEAYSESQYGDALNAAYRQYGSDPFIITRDPGAPRFSAWDYATEQCARAYAMPRPS